MKNLVLASTPNLDNTDLGVVTPNGRSYHTDAGHSCYADSGLGHRTSIGRAVGTGT